jgi:tRNA(fMet)-specific endonuclease VapC
MIYLLDSDTCIVHLRSRGLHAVSQRMAAVPVQYLALASIVEAELLFGAYRSSNPVKNLAEVRAFCSGPRILSFDRRVAEVHARLRAELARLGTPIGPYDSIIAATAIAHSLTLVSHNTREFQRVAGLLIEDWHNP